MGELFFLPDGLLLGSRLLRFGLLVLVAMAAGELCDRWLRLPRVLGFVVAGIVLGPSASAVITTDTLFEFRVLFHVTLGLVLFELGQRVDLGWLRRNPWLLATSLLEAFLSFAAVYGLLSVLDVRPVVAAMAAAIAVASSPAVALTVAKDLRAQGQVTERLLLLTALNCVYAYLALTMLFAWAHLEYRAGWPVVLLHPVYLIVGSLGLALALSGTTLWLMRHVGKRPDTQFVCVVAVVLLAIALANGLKLPVVLTLLAFGVLTRVLDRDRRFVSMSLGRSGTLVIAVLFAMTGASLEFRQLQAGATVALALAAVRAAGKAVAVFALARPSALPIRKASLLAIGLVPMSGLALLLVQDTVSVYPGLGPDLAAVMFSAIVMLEIIGPLAVHFALREAGEAAPRT
jgi:Kef-type K+ transport system membrane component KefB